MREALSHAVLRGLALCSVASAVHLRKPVEHNQSGTIVVAQYDEDVGWTAALRSHGLAVEVLQSKHPDARNFVDNVGNEAMKILRFIVDRYSSLPDRMIFVHAGGWDWHDPHPKNETLLSWDWSAASRKGGLAFLPSDAPCLLEDSDTPLEERQLAKGRWDHLKDTDGDHECLELEQHSMQQMTAVREAWKEVFEAELGALPSRWVTPCCAQFQVTRHAVLQHPRQFYMRLVDWVREHDKALLASAYGQDMKRNHDPQRRDAGHILEVMWTLLFRKQG